MNNSMELAIILTAFTLTTLIYVLLYRRLAGVAGHDVKYGRVSVESLERFRELLGSGDVDEAVRIYDELRRVREEAERSLEGGG